MAIERIWQVDQVANHFEQIIDAAIEDGPQIIREHGQDLVVVVSVKDWERPNPSLKNWLLSPTRRISNILD